jgi:hypothetical protein
MKLYEWSHLSERQKSAATQLDHLAGKRRFSMNRFFAGLLVYVISCSGIYTGCENKSVKTEPPKNQDNATSQTKQNVGSNIAEPTLSGKKFGPFDIDRKRIMVTYDYIGSLLEIKDEKGVTYFKKEYDIAAESSYTVENAFKLEGQSGEGLIIFYDSEPNAPPCGPEFQIFGMVSGSLKAMSPSIIVCGQFEKLPEGMPRGVLKLLDGDLIKVNVWKNFFGIRIPFKVDFQKMTIAPLIAQGVFDIDVHETQGAVKTELSNKVILCSDHNPSSQQESLIVSEQAKVIFMGAYADVQLEQAGTAHLDIKITNVWLKVKVDGKEGWVNDIDSFFMLGLSPSG